MSARPRKQTIEHDHISAVIDYQSRELTLVGKSGEEITVSFDHMAELLAILTALGHQVPDADRITSATKRSYRS